MVSGIHHVTLITRKVQANVDFYVGFLGLRLVKRTAGFEDSSQLHLVYGDGDGSPGSLITFLVWEDGSPGRAGHGQISEMALAIDPESIGFWLTRALTFGLSPVGPTAELSEPTIRLKDPDGVIVKLTGIGGFPEAPTWSGASIAPRDAIRRIRGVTLLTELPGETIAFLEGNFDYRRDVQAGAITRMLSESGDAVDVRDAQGFWPGAPGTGTFDHVAFRARDRAEVEAVQAKLGSAVMNVHDRKYFYSLYVREPGGALYELATDPPGMTVDETPETLGTRLFVPPAPPEQTADLEAVLPQFSLPGEPRIIYRDLPFIHRFFAPPETDGTTVFLFHGSGGNEMSLLPLARRTAPDATLLALRGRSTEEGVPRWFRRFEPLSFDQKDIASEAQALAAFLDEAERVYGIDMARSVFLGHSNGANFLAAFLLLHPQRVRKAILMRPVPVLTDPPMADLAGTNVLLLAGEEDPFQPQAEPLLQGLTTAGADARLLQVAGAGHDLSLADVPLMRSWLMETT